MRWETAGHRATREQREVAAARLCELGVRDDLVQALVEDLRFTTVARDELGPAARQVVRE